MEALQLLKVLTNDNPYFLSYGIIQQNILRCKVLLQRIALNINEKLKSELNEFIKDINPSDWAFICRSTAFRLPIENCLAELNTSHTNTSFVEDIYCAKLKNILKNIASLKDSPPELKEVSMNQIGFDYRLPLTSPYPFVTTLWNGFDKQNIWDEAKELKYYFETKTKNPYQIGTLELVNANEDQYIALKRALTLLGGISDFLLFDITMHVRHFAIFDIPNSGISNDHASSFSVGTMPGTCFLSPGVFKTFPYLVEALYHESLHMKYYQMIYTSPIHVLGYTGESKDYFNCPWMKNEKLDKQHWPFDRAFAAFHVYSHLSILYNVILGESKESLPRDWTEERLRICIEKGDILLGWIDTQYIDVLNDIGIDFFSRLKTVYQLNKSLLVK